MKRNSPHITTNQLEANYGKDKNDSERGPSREENQQRFVEEKGEDGQPATQGVRHEGRERGITPARHTRIVLETLRQRTDAVLLGFSGGKDSLVLADILHGRGFRVVPFFLHVVEGISFQEKALRWYERRYGEAVLRRAHPALHAYMQCGLYRPNAYMDMRGVRWGDVLDSLRDEAGTDTVVLGWKQSDSLDRRIVLRQMELEAIGKDARLVYPLSIWTDKMVMAHIRQRRLPQPVRIGRSGDVALSAVSLRFLRDNYPDDFARVLRVFPMADALIYREDEYGKEHSKYSGT